MMKYELRLVEMLMTKEVQVHTALEKPDRA